MNEQTVKYISGFWRRIGALCIDFAILGGIGFILGFFLEDTFAAMGAWGRLVGFLIALLYFGLMNSKLCGGQTAGKTFLNIKVVDSANETVGIAKSLARAFILVAPIFLNGAQFSIELMQSYLMYFFTFIVFGGFLSTVYLYVFNKNTQQSLHDLILGTLVVNAKAEKQELHKVSKIHFIVVAALLLAAAIAPVFTLQLAKAEPFKSLLITQAALAQLPLVTHVAMESGVNTTTSIDNDTKTTTHVHARIFLAKNLVGDPAVAREMALVIKKSFSESTKKDAIQLTLTYGHDIGIWSQWTSANYSFKPSELAEHMDPNVEEVKTGP